MKNSKKLLLLLIPVILAVWALYPTYLYNSADDARDDALAAASAEGVSPEDSLKIMEDYYKEYRDILDDHKDNRLKLGLDLRGGMYVTLEVDIPQMLEDMVYPEYRNEELFSSIIEATKEEAETSEESVIDIFLKHFDEKARPQNKQLVTYFDVPDLSEVSDEKIIAQLRETEDEAIDQAQQVIRQRIDKYGVAEPNIQKYGNKRIIVELPGVKDEGQIKDLLKASAKLEFKKVKSAPEDYEFINEIDEFLSSRNDLVPEETVEQLENNEPADATDTEEATIEEIVDGDSTSTDTTDLAEESAQDTTQSLTAADRPFSRLIQSPGGTQIFVPIDSLARLEEILRRPEVQNLIPFDTEVLFGPKEGEGRSSFVRMYVLNSEPELSGDVLTDANSYRDPQKGMQVTMTMNEDGAEKWGQITKANVGKQIAIVLDDLVYSAPNINEPILGGSSSISGSMNAEEARLLEVVLKAGSLKAPVNIIEERVVGASLGDDSINSGITASFIAFVLVVLFMLVYYGKGGLVADFAVILNVILIITFLAIVQGTLTLPGIAGIILTIGMAVDANVLIFERIREELARGRSTRAAIDEGYSKALSAILDSNITTFITAMILYFQGSGVIQGFALTLIFGIFATLFTAILVTRAIVEMSLKGPDSRFSFGQSSK